MVRLKVLKSLKNIKKLMKFQFLMVRLKVSSKSLSKSVPKNISIPYGAIKSQTGF